MTGYLGYQYYIYLKLFGYFQQGLNQKRFYLQIVKLYLIITDKINILDELLKRAENECNKFVKSKIETSFKISFLVEKSDQILKPKSNNIFVVADVLTWLNILSGKLNLETIIIGGVGKVIKLHEESMREVARCISEFAYVYQNKFTKSYFNS